MTNTNPPVCVPCKQDMICDQNGVLLVQFLEDNQPLTAVFADLFRCRQCGAQIIANRADHVVWNTASGFPLDELGGLRFVKMYSTQPYGAGNIFGIHFNDDGSLAKLSPDGRPVGQPGHPA